MQRTKKILIHLLILSVLALPILLHADLGGTKEGLVTCKDNCQWNELLGMVNRIVKFILFDLVLPISAIMFAYAGILLVTSGGSSEAKSKAKGIFTNVALGLILAVGAWLIISTILQLLGYDGSWIGLKLGV